MFPNLFGLDDGSYIFLIIIGVLAALVFVILYLKKKAFHKAECIDMLICGCFAIVLGIVFAVLFENIYEAIALKDKYQWVWKMTFYGGLLGGVVGFLLTYIIMKKVSSTNLRLKELVVVAPGAITIAHAFGRIGCFLAGCCYGKPTDSWIGITFPGIGKVIPTQLFEAIFLFILAIILLLLAFKKDYLYTFCIYLISYGIFRFIIEFFRGDERGVSGALSPSQIWSIILIIFAIPLYFYLKHTFFETNTNGKE